MSLFYTCSCALCNTRGFEFCENKYKRKAYYCRFTSTRKQSTCSRETMQQPINLRRNVNTQRLRIFISIRKIPLLQSKLLGTKREALFSMCFCVYAYTHVSVWFISRSQRSRALGSGPDQGRADASEGPAS